MGRHAVAHQAATEVMLGMEQVSDADARTKHER